MAREEAEREDLLREATALVERVELALGDTGPQVLVGFRRDGCASFYVEGDPAYHFNTAGALRRVFWKGELVKAEEGRLVALRRVRREGEVQLVRRSLAAEESAELLESLRRALRELAESLHTGHYRLIGQIPEERDLVARVREWLGSMEEIVIAQTPHAR